MAAQFLKGALISFTQSFVGAMPNVIIFQYNPETITHGFTAASGESPAHPPQGGDPLAARGVPGESFSFSLALDANDMIAGPNPVAAGLATVSGVYTRLAAIEMLQYPTAPSGAGLLGTVSASVGPTGLSVGGSSAAQSSAVPRAQVPVVLFVWGPQRIVPVRVTNLSITEKLFDRFLNPTHADVRITLRVLTPDELVSIEGPMKDIARVAYAYTQGLRQVQAMANLGDSAATIIGMLPGL